MSESDLPARWGPKKQETSTGRPVTPADFHREFLGAPLREPPTLESAFVELATEAFRQAGLVGNAFIDLQSHTRETSVIDINDWSKQRHRFNLLCEKLKTVRPLLSQPPVGFENVATILKRLDTLSGTLWKTMQTREGVGQVVWQDEGNSFLSFANEGCRELKALEKPDDPFGFLDAEKVEASPIQPIENDQTTPNAIPADEAETVLPGKDADSTLLSVVSIYTGNVANDKIVAIHSIVQSSDSAQGKLNRIHSIMPIPPNISAEKLGNILSVSKSAIQKTKWYAENRKGNSDETIEDRRQFHQKRSQQIQSDFQGD